MESKPDRPGPVTALKLKQALLGIGLVGTIGFVAAAVWVTASRVWAYSFTQTLEVLVGGPFVGIWILSPLVFAVWPRDEQEVPPLHATVSLIAAVLVVAAGGFALLSGPVLQVVFFEGEPSAEALVLLLGTPGVQWLVLGVAEGVMWLSGDEDAE